MWDGKKTDHGVFKGGARHYFAWEDIFLKKVVHDGSNGGAFVVFLL